MPSVALKRVAANSGPVLREEGFAPQNSRAGETARDRSKSNLALHQSIAKLSGGSADPKIRV